MNVIRWPAVRRALVLPLLLVLGPAACASGGRGGEGRGNTFVVVENNLLPPTSLSVYAVGDLGSRSLVGAVSPGATATLRFSPLGPTSQYRLVATTTAGAEIVSNPVTFGPGATLRWNVSSNIATVTSPG